MISFDKKNITLITLAALFVLAIVILSKQPISQKDELNSATHSSKIENVSDYRKYYKNIIQ